MAFTELRKLWWERVFERDREIFREKDTFDVKTGLILVILIFLAGESAEFFKSVIASHQSHGFIVFEKYLQSISVLFLVVGGIFAVLELWPRTFLEEAEPQEYEDRLTLLTTYYSEEPDPEEYAISRAFEERIEAAHTRIKKNSQINGRKSDLLNISFYCFVVSLSANLVTLAMRLF